MSGLKRDQYVRPARPVIRFSRGGSYQDPPEVSIEITGTPRAMEAWARKIEAVDELIDAMRSAVNNLDELEWDPGDHLSANAVADALRAALALLDPPTTSVDGGNGRDGHEVDIKISGNERATEIVARKIKAIDEIVATINWVVDDASYKAPELVDFELACMWMRKLEAALALLDPPTTSVDGAATGAGPENQETPR